MNPVYESIAAFLGTIMELWKWLKSRLRMSLCSLPLHDSHLSNDTKPAVILGWSSNTEYVGYGGTFTSTRLAPRD